ncbi:M15 family metallopeptidase [uncultured Paraglaciecola sp.]|uniref:M15 family metallopeptidase n=1 Tax=uncultured Paraglaciecola sp. TaxID=1765024 RepID=UPI002635234C|nr:M15 family metallopeptidase [uncultured Paraglaciecola sp.]
MTARAKIVTHASSKGGLGGLLGYVYFYCSLVVNWDIAQILTADHLESFVTGSIAAFTGAGAVAGWNRDQPSAAQAERPVVARRPFPKMPPLDDFDSFSNTPAKSGYTYSKRSLDNIAQCHPDLQKVAHRAIQISKYDFVVICGNRTIEEQKVLFNAGKSQAMNSRHVLKPSHALDIYVLGPSGGTWQIEPFYREVTNAFKRAAQELGIAVTCGIDWKSFVDAGHIELSKAVYPDTPDLVIS